MGYNPPNPLITCYRLGRFLVLVRVGGLGMLQSIIDIPREHTCSQINKNKLFSLVLSWFDLAVTLRWPYHDIGVAPLWDLTPTHFSMCTWVELHQMQLMYTGHWLKHNIIVLFGPFLLYQTGVTRRWFHGEWKTLQPLYYPCNLLGCFGICPCLGPRILRAIIDISSEHNFSKK